jgi:hypothetical protein
MAKTLHVVVLVNGLSCWFTIPPHRYGGADRCKQEE